MASAVPDGPSDAGLVHAALGGDVVGFSALLDRYRASLYAQALAYLGQPEDRSEEHTSELQSQSNIVCRLLLEKKNYKVIEDMVPKAKQVRDSLKRLAEEYAAKGKYLRWTTPLGLPVFNVFFSVETKQINTTLFPYTTLFR